VFDWEKEFPRIFSGDNPGFDVVIGNPPYGYMIPENEQQYFKNNYGPSGTSVGDHKI
jgi:23S rRNA G2445 N2-methylase RlmL